MYSVFIIHVKFQRLSLSPKSSPKAHVRNKAFGGNFVAMDPKVVVVVWSTPTGASAFAFDPKTPRGKVIHAMNEEA